MGVDAAGEVAFQLAEDVSCLFDVGCDDDERGVAKSFSLQVMAMFEERCTGYFEQRVGVAPAFAAARLPANEDFGAVATELRDGFF